MCCEAWVFAFRLIECKSPSPSLELATSFTNNYNNDNNNNNNSTDQVFIGSISCKTLSYNCLYAIVTG